MCSSGVEFRSVSQITSPHLVPGDPLCERRPIWVTNISSIRHSHSADRGRGAAAAVYNIKVVNLLNLPDANVMLAHVLCTGAE